MKIAIIGSGISGLTAAYLLSKQHDVTIFEKDSWIGGHTNTIAIDNLMVDTGFIVCNEVTYPNFMHLMRLLDVRLQQTKMSFSVTTEQYQYNGTNLNGIFADRKNIFSAKFYSLLYNIIKFNTKSKKFLAAADFKQSMLDFLKANKISSDAIENYVLPILSAIWSNDTKSVEDMPAYFVCKFFNNHGLLNLVNRTTWFTVCGGSKIYVDKMLQQIKARIFTSTLVNKISRKNSTIEIAYSGDTEVFDAVIIATHSDQALKLLKEPTYAEQNVLGNIEYISNDVILHTDQNLLPRNRRVWAAWNYKLGTNSTGMAQVTYNMNILQNLDTKQNYFVSLNQKPLIRPETIIAEFRYEHPKYNSKVLRAQQSYNEISGINGVYYCGAYWGYGFHEDGLNSGLRAVQLIDRDILCKTPFILDT